MKEQHLPLISDHKTETPKPLVAIVDDDKIFHMMAVRLMQLTNVSDRFLTFINGREAIEYLEKNKNCESQIPDTLFLDINMPIVDGWAFLEKYDSIHASLAKEVKIYMVSSSIDPRDTDRAKKNKHVLDYISKPVSKEHLLEIFNPE